MKTKIVNVKLTLVKAYNQKASCEGCCFDANYHCAEPDFLSCTEGIEDDAGYYHWIMEEVISNENSKA